MSPGADLIEYYVSLDPHTDSKAWGSEDSSRIHTLVQKALGNAHSEGQQVGPVTLLHHFSAYIDSDTVGAVVVYKYKYTHVNTHANTHANTQANTQANTHAYVHVNTNARTSTLTRARAYTHAHKHTPNASRHTQPNIQGAPPLTRCASVSNM